MKRFLSGYINVSNAVYLKVKSLYKDSTIAKVIELIENASLKRQMLKNLLQNLFLFILQ